MATQDSSRNLNGPPHESPLLQMMTGAWEAQAVYVAAMLGIADLLANGSQSIDELAAAAGASPRELYRLLRFLAGAGIFAEAEDGRFELTPLATALRSGNAGSVRNVVLWYGQEAYRAWGDLLHSIRTGETAFNQSYESSVFPYLARHAESADVFNQAMTEWSANESAAVMAAYDFSSFERIVDVGGGQGLFLTDLLRANPRLKGVLFDLPQAVEGAKEHFEPAGIADRCEIVGGDFFDKMPGGGDAYLLKNILVNWDDERSVALLRNCRRAMVQNGKLLVIEVSVIAPRNAPSFGKLFDLHMLVMTGGRGRSEAEFRALFERAGFRLVRIISTGSPVSIVEGVRLADEG